MTSAIQASTPTALGYTDSSYTDTTPDSGTLGSVSSSSDILSGSVTVKVGSGAEQTIDMSTVQSEEGGTTLSDLVQYISDNSSTLGFTASLGSNSLTLTSSTVGSTGALTVTSNLYDTAHRSSSTLAYTDSSDINSLTMLGISMNNDGSLTFDANSLDSILNTDFNSVVAFFQNTNSWGMNFSTTLENSGTSSSTGMLALAQNANSAIESTLNTDISKEESLISAEQKSLTAELNSANEILHELPSQLAGVNEIYSAISGYNQNTNG